MRRFYVAFAALCLLLASPAAAQQKIPPRKLEFLDSTNQVLPSEVGARYRRETEYSDSVAATVKIYHLATGKLGSQQGFSNLRTGVPSGLSEWWYPSGQLHFHMEYLLGRRTGELRSYYPNGQLKRREVYDLKDDFASTGECFAENGQPVPFYKFEQMPLYSEGDGGSRVIVMAIQRGVKYPRAALKAGCAGKVVVGFNVTSQGEVADIRVVKSVCPAIEEAVLDAVRKLKPFKPGQQDGKPVSVAFTLPVTFAIQ
jgi:protein TonB